MFEYKILVHIIIHNYMTYMYINQLTSSLQTFTIPLAIFVRACLAAKRYIYMYIVSLSFLISLLFLSLSFFPSLLPSQSFFCALNVYNIVFYQTGL